MMDFYEISIKNIFLIGICSGTISLTIARMKIFEWFRNLIVNLSALIDLRFSIFLDDLVRCYYCVAHWISLFFVLIFIKSENPMHFTVVWFSVVAIATFYSSLVNFLMERTYSQ